MPAIVLSMFSSIVCRYLWLYFMYICAFRPDIFTRHGGGVEGCPGCAGQSQGADQTVRQL